MTGFDYEGISYAGWTGAGGYTSLGSKLTLDRMIADGANSVSYSTYSGVSGAHASSVAIDQTTLNELETALYDAQTRGLHVLLKPILQVGDGTSTPALVPSDPAAFFASYKSMIVAYAEVAEKYAVDTLSIGNELDSLVGTKYQPYWNDLISAVRDVYSGHITYAASYAHPDQTSFLSQLDYLGVNPYTPLSLVANPTYQDLVDGWTKAPGASTWQSTAWGGQSYVDYLHHLSQSTGKPILFTELGYESESLAAREPGDALTTGAPNPTMQADLYRAFFEVWQPQNAWMKGAYLWTWSPNATPSEASSWATGYDFRDKPAESVIATAFGGPEMPPSATGPVSVISLKLAGDVWNGDPEVTLVVDGHLAGKATVNANPWLDQWQNVDFTGQFGPEGPHKIEVYFSNDAFGGVGADRNLYLSGVNVNGTALDLTHATNTAGSTWAAVGGPIAGMFTAGEIIIGEGSTPLAPSSVLTQATAPVQVAAGVETAIAAAEPGEDASPVHGAAVTPVDVKPIALTPIAGTQSPQATEAIAPSNPGLPPADHFDFGQLASAPAPTTSVVSSALMSPMVAAPLTPVSSAPAVVPPVLTASDHHSSHRHSDHFGQVADIIGSHAHHYEHWSL